MLEEPGNEHTNRRMSTHTQAHVHTHTDARPHTHRRTSTHTQTHVHTHTHTHASPEWRSPPRGAAAGGILAPPCGRWWGAAGSCGRPGPPSHSSPSGTGTRRWRWDLTEHRSPLLAMEMMMISYQQRHTLPHPYCDSLTYLCRFIDFSLGASQVSHLRCL